MLGKIRDYLKKHDSASLIEISAHLGTSKETTYIALDYWISKGKIRTLIPPCGSCGKCTGTGHLYQWITPNASHPSCLNRK